MKIKSAFVKQITEEKSVTVNWNRGKRNLESKSGIINPQKHEAEINDIFKMKTALDFDIESYKFLQKMSFLELLFTETKHVIGHCEFDLAFYANKLKEKTVKCVLDLKSDQFPGSQIYIYVNVQLSEPLPPRPSDMPKPRESVRGLPQGMTITDLPVDVGMGLDFDKSQNMFKLQKDEFQKNITRLEKQRIKLESNLGKLKFFKSQSDSEEIESVRELIKFKYDLLNKQHSKLKLQEKQENIILKVLGKINDEEFQYLFDLKDAEVTEKLEAALKINDDHKKEFASLKSRADVIEDFDYFADSVLF